MCLNSSPLMASYKRQAGREAALLSDRNEITQMTKFYSSHPYFQGISLPHKVFVNHRETDASYKQHWITLLVVQLSSGGLLCPRNANPALFLFMVYGPTVHASANLSRLSRMKDLK